MDPYWKTADDPRHGNTHPHIYINPNFYAHTHSYFYVCSNINFYFNVYFYAYEHADFYFDRAGKPDAGIDRYGHKNADRNSDPDMDAVTDADEHFYVKSDFYIHNSSDADPASGQSSCLVGGFSQSQRMGGPQWRCQCLSLRTR